MAVVSIYQWHYRRSSCDIQVPPLLHWNSLPHNDTASTYRTQEKYSSMVLWRNHVPCIAHTISTGMLYLGRFCTLIMSIMYLEVNFCPCMVKDSWDTLCDVLGVEQEVLPLLYQWLCSGKCQRQKVCYKSCLSYLTHRLGLVGFQMWWGVWIMTSVHALHQPSVAVQVFQVLAGMECF